MVLTRKSLKYLGIIAVIQIFIYMLWTLKVTEKNSSHIKAEQKRHEAKMSVIVRQGVLDNEFIPRRPEKNQSRPILDAVDSNDTSKRVDIAVTVAITFRKLKEPKLSPLFKHFIPTFCCTASKAPVYTLYVAHDHNDPFFKEKDSHAQFENLFKEAFTNSCCKGIDVSLRFVECPYSGKPAWAQNEASWQAYLNHHTYYYRVNDDTMMKTAGWVDRFINQLNSFKPPNVGIVGPHNIGGAQNILTYEFTHRTHMDIFGYYYPRMFPDWWGDNWISQTYRPGRSVKINSILVVHTMQLGQRYATSWKAGGLLKAEVARSQHTVQQYLEHPIPPASVPPVNPDKVIAMALYGAGPRYTYGAIRNALLARLWFPGWTMRLYIEADSAHRRYAAVPPHILRKLRLEGVQLVELDSSVVAKIPPMMWRFLAADDLSVKYFISRDLDSRLLPRDFVHVDDWLNKGAAVHCERDHPSHSNFALSGGLWGAQPALLRNLTGGKSMFDLIVSGSKKSFSAQYLQDMIFLNKVLWPKIKAHCMCHDAFSCKAKKYPNSHPVLLKRPANGEHLGQVYDEWGSPRQIDITIIQKAKVNSACTPL